MYLSSRLLFFGALSTLLHQIAELLELDNDLLSDKCRLHDYDFYLALSDMLTWGQFATTMHHSSMINMSQANNITVLLQSWDHPDSIHLRAKQRAEILSLGGDDPGTPPTAFNVPIFFVAYHSGVPVGCGSLRPLQDLSGLAYNNTAEIKRMFVDPAHRGDRGNGTSIAQRILGELEVEARGRGYTMLVLEIGDFLAGARRFYEKCGFVPRGTFGSYIDAPNSIFYEKSIAEV